METYVPPHVKQIAHGNLLYDAGNSNQGCVTTKRGVMGQEVGGRFRREGTELYLWLVHVDVCQKPAQYCKAIILQFKINRQSKKKQKEYYQQFNNLNFFSTLTSVFYSQKQFFLPISLLTNRFYVNCDQNRFISIVKYGITKAYSY